MSRYHPANGFTIVELLIVIVVIGILASITVVAFNGVQKKAYVTMVNDGGLKIMKVFTAYHAATNTFPSTAAYNCIGELENYPAQDNFGAGECSISSTPPYSNGAHEINDTAMTQIRTITSRLSVPQVKPILYVDSDAYYRGYFYSTAVSGGMITARIHWYFAGNNESCGAATYYSIDSGRNTMCRASVTMPQ